MSCGILEFSFSMRGRGEGGQGFAIDPHIPFACFLSSIPKKESKPGMDGALMSFSLRSIPPGVLSQFTSCPTPGVPRREMHVLCPSERFSPNLGPCPRIPRELLVL